MKYLADENVAAKIVAWLRNRGDEVRYAAEERLRRLEQCWSVVEANPSGCFIVITRQRVRVRPITP